MEIDFTKSKQTLEVAHQATDDAALWHVIEVLFFVILALESLQKEARQ